MSTCHLSTLIETEQALAYILQQALGGSSPQAMFHYMAALVKISGKTNRELVGLHVILYLLMLLQPEGDTSLELLNNNVKDHPFTLLMKCGNWVKKNISLYKSQWLTLHTANISLSFRVEKYTHTSSFPDIKVWVKISMGDSATSSLSACQHKACGLA